MHRGLVPLVGFQVTIVAAFAISLRARVFPLGVRGEWEWSRLRVSGAAIDVILAALSLAVYAVFVAMGMRFVGRAAGAGRASFWMAGLVVAAIAVQVGIQSGAPEAYGLTKWATLGMKGSNGYFDVAKNQMSDPWRFWADYPSWIRRQDALHVGTHPPGLFLGARAILELTERHPSATRAILDHLPRSIDQGFRTLLGSPPPFERAAMAATGALTLLACSLTVVPLFILALAYLPPRAAWAVASLWPIAPSAVLFQPTADTAFSLLSTTALALTAWAVRARPPSSALVPLVLSAMAGLALGLGMLFSLVFLPVGAIVALMMGITPGLSARGRGSLLLATAAGFLGVTIAMWTLSGANPFVIWWWNQKNHARFYVEFSRTYRAWIIANPIELAVALGIPSTVWASVGFARARASAVAWSTLFVLCMLNFSGKNLSEVARLWLPFMPSLLVAAGAGLERFSAGARTVAAAVVLVGLETLLLQSTIQVVYPV